MNLSAQTTRIFYAIGLIGWGIQGFMLGDFIAGRAPAWPLDLPGKTAAAYSAGLIFIISGAAVIFNRKAKPVVVLSGVMILAWAGIRNLVLLIGSLDYGAVLTNTNKSLSIGFGALLVASTFSTADNKWANALTKKLAPAAKYLVGVFLFVSGVQHFLFVRFVETLVPAWIPGATFWTYFSAVALIAGGIGLISGFKRKLAATLSGWMIFAWFIVLHLPRALGAGGNANEWTAVFEALSVSGLLFIIAFQEEK